jgi:hypothetical protein
MRDRDYAAYWNARVEPRLTAQRQTSQSQVLPKSSSAYDDLFGRQGTDRLFESEPEVDECSPGDRVWGGGEDRLFGVPAEVPAPAYFDRLQEHQGNPAEPDQGYDQVF